MVNTFLQNTSSTQSTFKITHDTHMVNLSTSYNQSLRTSSTRRTQTLKATLLARLGCLEHIQPNHTIADERNQPWFLRPFREQTWIILEHDLPGGLLPKSMNQTKGRERFGPCSRVKTIRHGE